VNESEWQANHGLLECFGGWRLGRLLNPFPYQKAYSYHGFRDSNDSAQLHDYRHAAGSHTVISESPRFPHAK